MHNPVIFLAFADSRDDLPNLKEERIALGDILEAHFNVEQKDRATQQRIEATFRTYGKAVRIFHFAGHANGEQIALVAGKDGHKGGYVSGVADYVGQQKGVELVFLNGCSTVGQVKDFQQAGIPALIATQAPVSDPVAREFAELFYANLLGGKGRTSFQEAFNQARAQLMGRYNTFPKLYNRSLAVQEIEFNDRFPYELYLRTTRAGDTCYQDLLLEEEGEVKAVPPLAHLLCDRAIPTDTFGDYLKDQLIEGERFPIPCLVHGDEQELPLRLCERFRSFTVHKVFERLDMVLEKSRIEFQEIEMPTQRDFGRKHKAMDRVRESLKTRLELSDISAREIRNMTAHQVLEGLDSHLKVVVLQHNLYAAEWDRKQGPAFLREYLEEFWKVSLSEEAPEVLLLFSLQYPPRKGLLGRFQAAPDLGSHFEGLAEVLELLIQIPRIDVRKWNDKYAPDDPGMTDRIFGSKKTLPMQVILPHLKAAVDRRRKI